MAKEYNKNYWLKELAFSFGMTIGQFADAIGYKRQTIYCASEGRCKLHKGHLAVAISKLTSLNHKILETGIQTAQERHEYRSKLIDEFAERFSREEDND